MADDGKIITERANGWGSDCKTKLFENIVQGEREVNGEIR